MATKLEPASICEVVGVFHSPEDLESAIDELLVSGFDRAELSLLASEAAVAEKLGGYYRSASDLADDPAVPRTAFVSTAAIGDAEGGLIGGLAYLGAIAAVGAVVMSGGAMAAIITAAVLAGGTGGLIGSALARWVGHHHAAICTNRSKMADCCCGCVRGMNPTRRERSRLSPSMRPTRFTRAESRLRPRLTPRPRQAPFPSMPDICRRSPRRAGGRTRHRSGRDGGRTTEPG